MLEYWYIERGLLRRSNILLYLKYKVLLCEPKMKFKKVAGGKALATDHRDFSIICDLAKDYKKRTKNQRQPLPFTVFPKVLKLSSLQSKLERIFP